MWELLKRGCRRIRFASSTHCGRPGGRLRHLPLALFPELLDFPFDQVALQHAEARLDQTENQEAQETGRVVSAGAGRLGGRSGLMMRIVFCGTPSLAVPTFKHLLAQTDFQIVGVITQPDRPRGRGLRVTPSPVKEIA